MSGLPFSRAIVLLPISSFSKEAASEVVSHIYFWDVKEWHIVSELIVAGFDDAHTAFLARAALARLQKKLSLPGHDLAVITRECENDVILQQVINLGDRMGSHCIRINARWRVVFKWTASGPGEVSIVDYH